ncbi:MAG TPA: fumarate/nitrate reduction transcriptional regulator Fnr [Pseudomonadales bacterium]|nr:fumarate/nitrate reduction transcriptional regulator Fnr [Pseudomonadales bacterium]
MPSGPVKHVVTCRECSLNALCIPNGLNTAEIDQIDGMIRRGRPIHRHDTVFREGDKFESIFAVRAGALKVFAMNQAGDEQVIGFYLPGEIFGLDAIDDGKHQCTAKALETSTVCEIPYTSLQTLSGKIGNLQTQMYRLLSREIRHDQNLQLLLSKMSAEERLSSFLLNLAIRYQQRKLSPVAFRLPMSRADIGNYLGLAVETVSRAFTRMQDQGIIHVEQREVTIMDRHQLCKLADIECPQQLGEALDAAAKRLV